VSRGGAGLLAVLVLVAAAGPPALAERVACSPDTFHWRGGRR
jgi:hypothetical protein